MMSDKLKVDWFSWVCWQASFSQCFSNSLKLRQKKWS